MLQSLNWQVVMQHWLYQHLSGTAVVYVYSSVVSYFSTKTPIPNRDNPTALQHIQLLASRKKARMKEYVCVCMIKPRYVSNSAILQASKDKPSGQSLLWTGAILHPCRWHQHILFTAQVITPDYLYCAQGNVKVLQLISNPIQIITRSCGPLSSEFPLPYASYTARPRAGGRQLSCINQVR